MNLNQIWEQLSKKHRLPKFVIEEIWKSQFEFTAEIMKEGDPEKPDEMKSVYLQNFGKFYPIKKKRK